MKTPDATTGVLLSEAAEPGADVPAPDTAEGEGRRGAAAGQAPIAITDGDFSTPTRRTRIVTRPRGLKTLEALGLLEGSSSGSSSAPSEAEPTISVTAGDFGPARGERRPPAEELTPPPDGWTRGTRRVSAVDEFLAALPTPVPELGPVTPPPDVPLSSSIGESPPVSARLVEPPVAPSFIENAASAAELRRAALTATPEPVPAPTRAPSAPSRESEPGREPADSPPPSRRIAPPPGALDAEEQVADPAAFDPREITAIRVAQDLETDLDHQLAERFHESAGHGEAGGALEIEVTPFHAEVRPPEKAQPATTPPGFSSESFGGDQATEPREAEAEAEAVNLKDRTAHPGEPVHPREAGEPGLGLGEAPSSAPPPGEPAQLDQVDQAGELGPMVGVAAEGTEGPPRSVRVGPALDAEPARDFAGPVAAPSPPGDSRESTSGSNSVPAEPKGAPAATDDASAEGGGEAALSPLALTLAHMAEAMQPEFGYEATDDVEILEPPAAHPAPDEAVPAVRARTNTPPPVPRHARGVAQDRVQDRVQDRGAVLPAPSRPEPEALAERPRRPKRSKPWFEEIFDENYLRTLPFMTPQQTLREVDFLQATLNVQPGACILDVGCGYGRHAIELVQRGLAVTGLDLSLPLLIRAADESQRRNLVVDFVHGDMRHMAFERQFDAAYSMLTSFGYFDEESNLRVAEGIARALKPGGRLLLDVVNRDYVVGDLPTRVWWEGDGCVVLEEVEFNFNTNRLLTHRSVVFDDGRQLDQEISLRAYSLHDLGKLLRLAGFRILEVSGSIFTRGHYFGAASRNLIVLAERRAD